MTATTSTAGGRERSTTGPIRRSARLLGDILVGIGSWWNDRVNAGHLGPGDQTLISRHTGARI
jgi:hypothetical protein